MRAVLDTGLYSFRCTIIYGISLSAKSKHRRSQFIDELVDYLELGTAMLGRLLIVGIFNVLF